MASDMNPQTGTAITLRSCVRGEEQALAQPGRRTFRVGRTDWQDVILGIGL